MRLDMRLMSLATVLAASAAASVLTPPVLPLIVRTPYLSTWLPNARGKPWEQWPMFWTGQEVGLAAMLSVPGSDTVYPLLGRPQDSLERAGHNVSYPKYLGATFDASTTNLSYSIPAPAHLKTHQPLSLKLSFLSPITPTSTKRQSIPAGYISVEVKGTFDVNFYIDVNGLWASGDRGSRLQWSFQHRKPSPKNHEHKLKSWSIWKENQQLLTEYNDRSEWGTFHFLAPADVSHEAGTSAVLRQSFFKTGALRNTVDLKFRGIMDEEPVFAYSKSFRFSHKNTTSKDSLLFTIAHTQDEVIQYASERGLTMMRPLWKSWFITEENLLLHHYYDFNKAAVLAQNYSAELYQDGLRSGSHSYADIVSVSARQVLGATQFAGTPEDPVLFMKEISSDGNLQTADVIYPSFPFFLYTNPRWLAYLLEPLVEHQLSGQYPNMYSMHDLGAHYPNATGHPDGRDEYMPVEECGNMLILGLAVVNSLRYETPSASGSKWSSLGEPEFDTMQPSSFPLSTLETRDGIDGLDSRWGGNTDIHVLKKDRHGEKQARKWIKHSYHLWRQWTSYLVEFSLVPANQLSTDDFAGWLANQTNLAVKGIIGIKAMAELASVAGEEQDAKHFDKIARDYIAKWEDLATSRDGKHLKLAYTWYGSWTTVYNIFADSLLCFHLENTTTTTTLTSHSRSQKPLGVISFTIGFVPRRIYKLLSSFYPTVLQRYGLPLDSRHLYSKSDWQFFSAAIASNSTRSAILDSVALWVNETTTDRPLTDLYDTEGTGGFPGPSFFARPVVGGHFSFLALERACQGKAVDGLKFLDE